MGQSNCDIRKAMKENNLKFWQVAEKLGLNDGNFSRKLRKELSDSEKQKIRQIIFEIKEVAQCQE